MIKKKKESPPKSKSCSCVCHSWGEKTKARINVYHCPLCGCFFKDKEELYKEAMKAMECWESQEHVKKCPKCHIKK